MKNKQKGFVTPIIIIIVALLAIGGGAYFYTNNKVQDPIYLPEITNNVPTTTSSNIVGGDKDEHGCLGSAGYSWCAVKNKCLRTWEEKCEVSSAQNVSATTTITNEEASEITKCGLTVISPTANEKIKIPVVINGTIDNSKYQTLGCSWVRFEGTAGTAQLYHNYNNEGWKIVGNSSPIYVADWTAASTTFTTTLNFNNDGIGLPLATPMKVVLTEEDPSGRGLTDSVEIPFYLSY